MKVELFSTLTPQGSAVGDAYNTTRAASLPNKQTRVSASEVSILCSLPPKRQDSRTGDRHVSRKGANKPIIFVDGEGANVGSLIAYRAGKYQRQNYALLSAIFSTGEYRRIIGVDGIGRLSTVQCLRFLLDLPRTHIIVGYGIGYDVEQILYDLPEKTMRRLHEYGHVKWKQFSLTYKPRKSFSVSYLGKQETKNRAIHPSGVEQKTSRYRSSGQCVTWWDIAGFFQTRFDTACEMWKVISPTDLEFMARMKDKRDQFAGIDDEQIEYNKLEGTHGCKVFASLRREWVSLGLPVRRYDGAGAIASAMFSRHGVDEYIHQSNPIDTEVMLRAYLGGRFDFTNQGLMGDAIEYDINSAYPHIARNLPCLTHGIWRQTTDFMPSPYSLWFVRWQVDGLWAPFPYRRRDGRIGYYATGSGWYYGDEVAAALRLYPQLEIVTGFILDRDCDHRPFAWIEPYYEHRQELKQAGSFGEKVLKLGLNSVYGKCAQSKGHTPKFQCLIWAGMITSGTRAMILDALAQNPDAALVTATDAVITTESLQLSIEQLGLGWWERKDLQNICVVGNGLYQSTDGHKVGSRGYDKKAIDWDAIRSHFANGETSFTIDIPNTAFFGSLAASTQKVWDMRCTWEHRTKQLQVKCPEWKFPLDGRLWPLPNPDQCPSYPARINPANLRLDEPSDGLTLVY